MRYIYFLLILFTLGVLTSCAQEMDEDTAQKLLARKWMATYVLLDGNRQDMQPQEVILDLKKDGSGSITELDSTLQVSWAYNPEGKMLALNFNESAESSRGEVLKLDQDELVWVIDMMDTRAEMHYMPVK